MLSCEPLIHGNLLLQEADSMLIVAYFIRSYPKIGSAIKHWLVDKDLSVGIQPQGECHIKLWIDSLEVQ